MKKLFIILSLLICVGCTQAQVDKTTQATKSPTLVRNLDEMTDETDSLDLSDNRVFIV